MQDIKKGMKVNWPALVAGAVLVGFGVVLFIVQYVNDWQCAHSHFPVSCMSPESGRIFFDYPLIAIGAILITFSALASVREGRRK